MAVLAESSSVVVTRSLDPGLLLGLLLLAAIVGGYSARLLRIPRVVGFLVAGVVLRCILTAGYAHSGNAAGAKELLAGAAEPLAVIKTLALGLIMFTIGNVFEAKHIKTVGSRVLKISLLEAACVIALVGTACAVVWTITSSAAKSECLAAGLLLGVVALATAPAATLLVLREYDAKGPVSDTLLTLTAINNTVSIILFHSLFLLLSAAGIIASAAGGDRILWLDLVLTSVGSVVLGCLLGFLFSVLYSKITLAEFLLVFFGVLLGLGVGAEALSASLHLSFNFLLICLFLGAVFTNITLNSGPFYESLRTMAAPIFAAFFVIAGYELHIEDLTSLGWLGGFYVLFRIAGKYVGVRLGVRWADWSAERRLHSGLGMLCQAGVAIGLADFISDAWVIPTAEGYGPHPLAVHFKTVVLGSIVVFEMLGPVVLKSVVKSAGEVKAITLLRRRRSVPAEGDSITRLTWDALLRTFGLRRTSADKTADDPRVRHIMRSNVKFLRASARLDEVLHFVESSRFNHFPVVDEAGDFVGMIHFADLRGMLYDPHLRDLVTAVDLACPDDMVPADMPLADLLERFKASDVGSLVVVESGDSRRVVGLVEQRDLLRVLHGGTKTSSG